MTVTTEVTVAGMTCEHCVASVCGRSPRLVEEARQARHETREAHEVS